LKKAVSFALAVLSIGGLSLPAWADENYPANYDMEYYSQLQGQNISLNVYNWGEYIANGDDGSMYVNQ